MRATVRAGALAQTALVLLLSLGCGLAGCHKPPSGSGAVNASVVFDSPPPTVGANTFRIQFSDAAGQPVSIDGLEVEGDMNHAGMKPSFATVKQTQPGHYAGTVEFTMGGDWFLLITGRLTNGGRIEQKIAVPGVQSK